MPNKETMERRIQNILGGNGNGGNGTGNGRGNGRGNGNGNNGNENKKRLSKEISDALIDLIVSVAVLQVLGCIKQLKSYNGLIANLITTFLTSDPKMLTINITMKALETSFPLLRDTKVLQKIKNGKLGNHVSTPKFLYSILIKKYVLEGVKDHCNSKNGRKNFQNVNHG